MVRAGGPGDVRRDERDRRGRRAAAAQRAPTSATGGHADLIRCAGDGSNEAVYLIIPPDNPEMFAAVTEVIGRPELSKDERFATPPARARNAAALTGILEGWARSRGKHEVMKALASRGPVRLSDSPVAPSRAPLMGEHTEAVLTRVAGFSAEEVRTLRDKRVI